MAMEIFCIPDLFKGRIISICFVATNEEIIVEKELTFIVLMCYDRT